MKNWWPTWYKNQNIILCARIICSFFKGGQILLELGLSGEKHQHSTVGLHVASGGSI